MQSLITFITENELQTIILAIVVNVLTALIKLPIKKLAVKNGVKTYTGFIVFIPIIASIILAVLYQSVLVGSFTVNKSVLLLSVNVASLSLAIYAVIEKVIPKNYVYLTENEIELNNAVIEKLKNSVITVEESKTENDEKPENTIVLKGG